MEIMVNNNFVSSVITNKGEVLCDSIIVCTGGISYPTTGSTGDGYKFAKKFGHEIVDLRPGLVGIELNFFRLWRDAFYSFWHIRTYSLVLFFND